MLLPGVPIVAMQAVPTPLTIPTAAPTSVSERSVLNDRLDALAAKTSRELGGTLGVVVWDLGTGVSVQRNAQLAFPMASVAKLPLAVAAYAAIDAGKLKPDQAITLVKSDVVTTVSPLAAEYDKGHRVYALRELISRMLEDSDNTAADAVYRVLGGADALNDTMNALGIDGIVFRTNEAGLIADAKAGRTFARGGDNAGSPAAVALLLSDLAQGRILSDGSRQQVRDMLARVATFPGRLRAGFSASTHIEHKTGTSQTLGGVTDATNDVGIVNANGRTIVVVAMLMHARGSDAQRDAVLANAAQIANDATRLFPTQ